MIKNKKNYDKEMEIFALLTLGMFLVMAFVFATPREILQGMIKIVISQDKLITDYFSMAGYGATFFNVAMLLAMSMAMVKATKIPYTGLTITALALNIGFGFWGKNPINVLPIILGTWLYAKLHKAHFARYVFTALTGTALAPVMSALVYILPFHTVVNLLIAIVSGIFIGFVLPPLSMHTTSMHMGYCLTNIGFASGILAIVVSSVLRTQGIRTETILIWEEGMHIGIVIVLTFYLVATFLFGFILEKGDLSGLKKIMKHPGRAVADFVITDGEGPTLMNMALMGLIAEAYIILVGGDFSGPIIGSIFVVMGFASFGAHIKNYPPILLGVFLSTFLTVYSPDAPALQIAALFSVALAPICGQFGVIPGIIAGLLHVAIVTNSASFYGGLNLYNNGFSAGWVAVIMIPILESFMKRFGNKKGVKGKK